MTTRRIIPLALLAVAALSCSEATSPNRAPNYDWRWFLGSDTLSFHWPANTLPVKIWVEDSLDMPALVQEGVDTWRDAFLYGEYDAVLVSDSSSADVVVRVAPIPPKAPAKTYRLNTMLSGCEAVTSFDIDTLASPVALRLPVRIYVAPLYDPGLYDLTDCLRIAVRHELGHSIGIFQHTSDTRDIMYGDPEVTELSLRDINTAQLLSHWPSNMVPIR
jgi:predicted Zn-dependent protease